MTTTLRNVSAFAFAFLLIFMFTPNKARADESQATFELSVTAVPFSDFEPKAPTKRQFGSLTFLSGAYLASDTRAFGGFSAMKILDQGKRVLGVSDSGYWLHADIERDAKGAILGFNNVRMATIYSGHGPRQNAQKYYRDAEALIKVGNEVYVAFEAINAISRYPLDLQNLQMEPSIVELPKAVNKASINKGMEALALGAPGSNLANKMVAITERGENRHSDSFGFILELAGENKNAGEFRVKRDNLYDVTDAVFLKNGNMLLLERRFTIADGVAMRMRLIKSDEIVPGAHLTGEVIFSAGLSHRIDNMEALSIFENAKGETVLAFLSDDNHSILQRTVYFEFLLDKKLIQ